jgi:hypothetical protein
VPNKPKPPRKSGSSGEHPAVVEFRRKLESIAEHTIPAVEELIEKIEKADESTRPPPKKDPRREDDEEIPVDVVGPEKEEKKP